ncbi:hypothetical protein VTO73DRAFT_64 [Trametes versicolor]
MANANDTIGAILVGALVSAVLSGTVTTQAFIYFRLYGGDDYKRNTFMAIVTLISHCFFAHRIYVLSGFSWWLTAPILVLACARLVAAFVSTSEMITLRSYEAFVDRVGWVFTMGLSLSTAVDVLITITLIVLLQRSRTGYSTITDHLIDVVTLYTVETGLVTSITTAVSLICWLAMPRNLIFLALHFSISKLYATSTLATLNARKSLRRRTHKVDDHILPVISSLHEAQSATQREREDVLDPKSEHAGSEARIRVTRVELKPEQDGTAEPPTDEARQQWEEEERHRRHSREHDPLPPVYHAYIRFAFLHPIFGLDN